MNAKNLENLLRVRKEPRGHEYKPERRRQAAQLRAEFLRPFLKAGLIEGTGPMCGYGMLTAHTAT